MTHATYVLEFVDYFRHKKSWSHCTTFFIKTILLYFIKILTKAHKRLWNVPTVHDTEDLFYDSTFRQRCSKFITANIKSRHTRMGSIARIISEILRIARDGKPT